MKREPRVDWFIRNKDNLKHRSFLIGIFTETEYDFVEPLDIGGMNEIISVEKDSINKQLKRSNDLQSRELISDYVFILGLNNTTETHYELNIS